MLKIQDLSYQYPDGSVALKNVSFELPPEHILAILGESGSGKTTLLNIISKFLPVQSGKITLNDGDIREMEEKEFRRSIGVVFQRFNLFPHMTVMENLTIAPVRVMKQDIEEARDMARDTLERLSIEQIADRYPGQISGGQAQRVAIARSLVMKPEYLLLDEPTSALDVNTTKEFGEWLKNLKAETTFVVVTHDVIFTQEAATLGVVLVDGEIKGTGKVNEILNDFNRGS